MVYRPKQRVSYQNKSISSNLIIASLTVGYFYRTLINMSNDIFSAFGNAWEASGKLLCTPFRLRFLLKLALVVILASFLSAPGFGGSLGGGHNQQGDMFFSNANWFGYDTSAILALGMFIILFLCFLFLIFILVINWLGALFNFTLLDILITQETRIRTAIGRSVNYVWSLFLWYTFFTIIILGFMILININFGRINEPSIFIFGQLFMLFFIYLPLNILLVILMIISIEWVLPVMRSRSCGFLTAWIEILTISLSNLGKVLLYIILRFCIAILGGIYLMFVFFVCLLVYCIVFGLPLLFIIGASSGFDISSINPIWLILLIPIGLGVFVLFIYTMVIFSVPLVVYRRYFSLFVLECIAPELDIMPKPQPPELPGEDHGFVPSPPEPETV